jgi:putative ABC transport system permease protein
VHALRRLSVLAERLRTIVTNGRFERQIADRPSLLVRMESEAKTPQPSGDGVRLWFCDLAQDIRFAWRSLRRTPAFAAVAVATLALGIGANAAMFSVLNTFLIRPLPYQEPDRLVRVFRTSIHSQSWPHSVANFLDHRRRNTVFDYLVVYNGLRQSLTVDGQPAEGLQGLSVTAEFFPALGVPPALGRWFTAEEDQPDRNRVAVLSDGFWRRRFGADPSIVGRTLQLEGQDVTIVGVMPPGFEHPLLWGPH